MKQTVSKKLLSLVLALLLLCSSTVASFALGLSPGTEKSTIRAGETVEVTLTLDEDIVDVTGFEARLYFDATLFDFVPDSSSAINNATVVKNVKEEDGRSFIRINYIFMSDPGYTTVSAGYFAKVVFTAKADIDTEAAAAFSSCITEGLDKNQQNVKTDELELSLTVKPAPKGYQVSLSPETQAPIYGEAALVTVTIENEDVDHYNAVDLSLSYTASALRFDREGSTLPEDAVVTDNEGALRIQFFGEDRSDALQLAFVTTAVADSTVELLEAHVDDQANANVQDAPAATIDNATAAIACGSYPVTLSPDFEGAETVRHGEDYTFTARDLHYDYVISATMGGEEVEVIDNGDGTYTIKNVTGPLVITDTRSGKQYSVTVEGSAKEDITAADTATYMTDYVFTVNRVAGFSYDTPVITVDGQSYTGFTAAEDGSYTIPGSDITGAIVITVNKTAVAPTTVTVTVTGSGAGDFSGESTAVIGQDYHFTINMVQGYGYDISATMGGESVAVVDNGDGSYTIRNVSADLTIYVDKTLRSELLISEYVKLDGKTMWLVTMSAATEDGKVYAYDGTAMYWSEQYQAYAWLVITDNEEVADAFAMEALAMSKLSQVQAAKTSIDYSGDVNGTGLVDINDAQLVYNMYNARYQDFSVTSMLMFLRADLNGSRSLNVQDAAAVVALIK